MKLHLFCATLITASCLQPVVQAGEVFLTSLESREAGDPDQEMTAALIERQHGPYIGAWLGGASGGKASLSGNLAGADIEGETSFTGGFKFGYYFRTPYFVRPSIELEVGYLDDQFSIDGGARQVTGGGDFRSFFGTANLILALDLGAIRDEVGEFVAALHPYIGAGIGTAYSTSDTLRVTTTQPNGSVSKQQANGGSQFGFAYQFMAGLEVDLGEDFSIFGEYKRLGISQTGSDSIGDYERNLWVLGCKLGY